ncbi:hypothetical protein ACFX2I_031837 [Malus domestica]
MELLHLGEDSSMQSSNVVVRTLLSQIVVVAEPTATGKLLKIVEDIETKLGSKVQVRIKIDERHGCAGSEKQMQLVMLWVSRLTV